ncbi:hypothetical protein EG68_12400 [Paragonimus skrjabini miyazakii]|uniref:Uncharacterized protein n=1 Tax=Paragonimus skrjabini miyazakii TaxID=59628 RepID=A0A8S9YG46_9TREM|nr:hypothetical protein EG68_12400 [Paragonimus skrjabini miyazakii]
MFSTIVKPENQLVDNDVYCKQTGKTSCKQSTTEAKRDKPVASDRKLRMSIVTLSGRTNEKMQTCDQTIPTMPTVKIIAR